MARIGDERIRNMSGIERIEYVDNHPSEGLRFIVASASEAKYFGKRYTEYQKNRLVEAYFGNALSIFLPQE